MGQRRDRAALRPWCRQQGCGDPSRAPEAALGSEVTPALSPLLVCRALFFRGVGAARVPPSLAAPGRTLKTKPLVLIQGVSPAVPYPPCLQATALLVSGKQKRL